jgi:hypothetical protein
MCITEVPRSSDECRLQQIAYLPWIISCSGGSPVTLDTLRKAAKAGEDGTKSQLHKSFYTSVPSEYLDEMERSAVKRMGLEFDSSKEHYHVKVGLPQCKLLVWGSDKCILESANFDRCLTSIEVMILQYHANAQCKRMELLLYIR